MKVTSYFQATRSLPDRIIIKLDASKVGRVYFIPAYMCLGLPGAINTEFYLEELKEQLISSD
ncbi:MAG: hypothetical protein AAGE84_04290 [Cyanobacteria bacterium P01_G01_bin.39]